jgi:mannitol-specific phosphotransferase system IIBC component
MSEPTQTKTTTMGGTLLVFFMNITSGDLIKTVVLTAIGAIVSFVMSQLIKMVMKWWKARKV